MGQKNRNLPESEWLIEEARQSERLLLLRYWLSAVVPAQVFWKSRQAFRCLW